MSMTLSEKILARHASKEKVIPGEYIVVKDLVGPICYSFRGVNNAQIIQKQLSVLGVDKIAKPENCILNGDHSIPHQTAADVELFKSVRKIAAQLGINKVYDREGIGHVVNIEKGDVAPGKVFVHMDPQAMIAGGVGAYYTNGGRFGSTQWEAFALGHITVCVPGTFKIVINGKLPSNVVSRDVWFKILNDIGPDAAYGMVIEFSGSTIDEMCIEQRMVLCGSASYAGADSAIIKADEKTQQWFKENFRINIDTIEGDEDAGYAKELTYDAKDFVPMVTFPPEVFTAKPAKEFGGVKIDQCIMGTCAGGTLDDLRTTARILEGKKIHKEVRFMVSPVTQRVYVQAAAEGLLKTIAEAGALVLSPTCDVCLGVIGPLVAGEVCLSQQTLNVPGRSGSKDADIYLASAATIATSAITGYITDPR